MGPEGVVNSSWDRADGRGYTDFAWEGVAFWFRGFNNTVNNNVAADCGSYGYTYFAVYLEPVRVPLFKGADKTVADQYQLVDMNATPLLEFSGNQAYGAMPAGMTIWWLGTVGDDANLQTGESVVSGFKVWHVHEEGYFGYETYHLTFDGFVARDNPAYLQGSASAAGITSGDYLAQDLDIKNADIQGFGYGFQPSLNTGGGTQTLENSYLRNQWNVYVPLMSTSWYRSDLILPRLTILRDVTFASYIIPDVTGGYYDIYMDGFLWSQVTNMIQRDQLFVYNYNGVAGDNFQVFYLEQSPTFVVPQSIYNDDGSMLLTASPVAGLTNQQNWATYGIAVAGAVSPTSNKRDKINGFVQALTGAVVTGMTPASGPSGGGTVVTLSGSGFTGASAVYFGTTAAASFTVNSDTSITMTAPAHAAGMVDITVKTTSSTSARSGADVFTYNLAVNKITTTLVLGLDNQVWTEGFNPIADPLSGYFSGAAGQVKAG
jgi:hypothetical protein